MSTNLVGVSIGTMIAANKLDGTPYINWRCKYINKSGMLGIWVDPTGDSDYIFVFFPFTDNGMEHFLRTSPGVLSYDKESKALTMTTMNSVYKLKVNPNALYKACREEMISFFPRHLFPKDIVKALVDGKEIGEDGYYKPGEES